MGITLIGYANERTDRREGLVRILAREDPDTIVLPLNRQMAQDADASLRELLAQLQLVRIPTEKIHLILDALTSMYYGPALRAARDYATQHHIPLAYALTRYDIPAMRELEHDIMSATWSIGSGIKEWHTQFSQTLPPHQSRQDRLRQWDVMQNNERGLCTEYWLWRTRHSRHDIELEQSVRSAAGDKIVAVVSDEHLYDSVFSQTLYSRLADLQPKRMPLIE